MPTVATHPEEFSEEEFGNRQAEANVRRDAINSWVLERNAYFSTVVTAGATFLTLMATSTIGVTAVGADRFNEDVPIAARAFVDDQISKIGIAQFALVILFSGLLTYYVLLMRACQRQIADEIAKRHYLEKIWRLPQHEMEVARFKASVRQGGIIGRIGAKRPSIYARIPQAGVALRYPTILLPTALLPAVMWFAVAADRRIGSDLVVALLLFANLLALRSFYRMGCRYWIWMNPKTGELVRNPYAYNVPARWWSVRAAHDADWELDYADPGKAGNQVGAGLEDLMTRFPEVSTMIENEEFPT